MLITNVNIFDGENDALMKSMNVLIENNFIKTISSQPIVTGNNEPVIDGGGLTLMPGLLDSHVHLMLNDAPHKSIYEETWAYVGAQAVAGAKTMLLRGFTTVRDVGGPVGGLKKA